MFKEETAESGVLQLEGTHNFRSLQGLQAADGRRIAGHTVLRSDHLNSLSTAAWGRLQALGLKTICDLRGVEERSLAPTPLPPSMDVRRLNFDIRNDVRSDPALASLLNDAPTAAGTQALMQEIYRRFPMVFAPQLSHWFALFENGDVPVLVHCTAGKDRTGFLVALLLHALGVPHATIMEDYLRSAPQAGLADRRIPGLQQLFRQQASLELEAEAILPILDVQPSYLQAAYDVIAKQYGSLDGYLLETAALDTRKIARLRQRYLS